MAPALVSWQTTRSVSSIDPAYRELCRAACVHRSLCGRLAGGMQGPPACLAVRPAAAVVPSSAARSRRLRYSGPPGVLDPASLQAHRRLTAPAAPSERCPVGQALALRHVWPTPANALPVSSCSVWRRQSCCGLSTLCCTGNRSFSVSVLPTRGAFVRLQGPLPASAPGKNRRPDNVMEVPAGQLLYQEAKQKSLSKLPCSPRLSCFMGP